MRYKFKHNPYAHQREALVRGWKKTAYAYLMDMGTGKSKVAIDNAGILYDQGHIDSMLIFAPKGVYRNWSSKELPTHLPEHIVADIVVWSPEKTQKKQKEFDVFYTPNDHLKIFVMNIEALSTKRGLEVAMDFLTFRKTMIVVDESTTIKNPKAKRTKSIIKLGRKAAFRRILTGSPITKSPLDLFSQCEFLEEGILGQSNFYCFQNRYAKMVKRTVATHSFTQITGYQNLEELNQILQTFSYRVRKDECLDLPDKVYVRREVELTPEQRVVYDQMKANAIALLAQEGVITAPVVLTQILRLLQICGGNAKLEDGRVIPLPCEKLAELLQCVEETTAKVIVWANFTDEIKLIAEALRKEYGNDSVATYFGETTADEREQIVKDFQDPHSSLRFFVGQPRTGGYGLTLTEATTVIYYSRGYDLEVRMQSEDRAHRIGQTNKVTYVDIVTAGTVEEKVLQALRNKMDIAGAVLGEGYQKWLI